MQQVPTVGRILHYYLSKDAKYAGKQPMAAMVTYVNTGGTVTVRVTPPLGRESVEENIVIIPHPGAEPVSGPFCEWPPIVKNGNMNWEPAFPIPQSS